MSEKGVFYGRGLGASGVSAATGAALGLVEGLKAKEDARRFDTTLNENKRQHDNDMLHKMALLRHAQKEGRLTRAQEDRLTGLDRALRDKMNSRDNSTQRRGQSLDFESQKQDRRSREQIENDNRTQRALQDRSLEARAEVSRNSGLPRDAAIRAGVLEIMPGLDSMSVEDQNRHIAWYAAAYDAAGAYGAGNRVDAENARSKAAGESTTPEDRAAEAELKKNLTNARIAETEARTEKAKAEAEAARLKSEAQLSGASVDPRSTPGYNDKLTAFTQSLGTDPYGDPVVDMNKVDAIFGYGSSNQIVYAESTAEEDFSMIHLQQMSTTQASNMVKYRGQQVRRNVLARTGEPALADAAESVYASKMRTYYEGGVMPATSLAAENIEYPRSDDFITNDNVAGKLGVQPGGEEQ